MFDHHHKSMLKLLLNMPLPAFYLKGTSAHVSMQENTVAYENAEDKPVDELGERPV
jgi:hypothetical protein